MQPISKPLSAVLAVCGRFVVTWSVQENSCGHLVCAGIFLHSPVLLCGPIGLNKTKHRNTLGISTFTSLLTVRFNVPKNAMNLTEHGTIKDVCKCYEHTLVCYFS